MRINSSDLRQHYESLSDEELLALDRADLVDLAKTVYDEEVARRGLDRRREEESPDEFEESAIEPDLSLDDGPPPDWLEDAACAYSAHVPPGGVYADRAAEICAVLRAAGIPSHVTVEHQKFEPAHQPPDLYRVMVPGELNMYATSVIERDVFNPQEEESWRTHLQGLSDEQLRVLKPEIFCASLLDKAERMKRAYLDEMASRKR